LGADLNRYSSTVEMKHGGETVAKLEHGSELRALAFSPNGRWLATATKDGGMRLWPLQAAELIERACQLLARNLTENEWKEARLEGPYRKTCPNLP
jgi:WD40 repeat protein